MNDAGFDAKDKWHNLWADDNIANKDLVKDLIKEPSGFDLPWKEWTTMNRQGHPNTSTNGISKTPQHVTEVTQIRLSATLRMSIIYGNLMKDSGQST